MAANVILRGLSLQEEYRCAWEAVRDFTNTESFTGQIGRRYSQGYTFELEGEPDIRLEVWRSQRGIEVARPNRLDEELTHELRHPTV